ncbi:MAG: hypothetical protein GYA23_09225 [Methanomicrobiales archaeon]|nr:hypothetical protein [Methanomicrobiales archaeon]
MAGNTDIREIIYHCPCRRFVEGSLTTTSTCHECGRQHAPSQYKGED